MEIVCQEGIQQDKETDYRPLSHMYVLLIHARYRGGPLKVSTSSTPLRSERQRPLISNGIEGLGSGKCGCFDQLQYFCPDMHSMFESFGSELAHATRTCGWVCMLQEQSMSWMALADAAVVHPILHECRLSLLPLLDEFCKPYIYGLDMTSEVFMLVVCGVQTRFPREALDQIPVA